MGRQLNSQDTHFRLRDFAAELVLTCIEVSSWDFTLGSPENTPAIHVSVCGRKKRLQYGKEELIGKTS